MIVVFLFKLLIASHSGKEFMVVNMNFWISSILLERILSDLTILEITCGFALKRPLKLNVVSIGKWVKSHPSPMLLSCGMYF